MSPRRRVPAKKRVTSRTRTPATPKYHRKVTLTLEDLEYIADDQLEEDELYKDPRVEGYAPVPEAVAKMPYGAMFTLEEMQAMLTEIAAWAEASGMKNILFLPEDYASFIGFKPFSSAEREQAKKDAEKKAATLAKRRENAIRRKETAARKEEERQRNLLRTLVKKFPDEVKALNSFED